MARAWEATRKDADHGGRPRLGVACPSPCRSPRTSTRSDSLAVLERPAPRRSASGPRPPTSWSGSRRCRAGDTIDVGCLRLEQARVLHMPGELFVEYQLAAQKMRPDLFVAMAAYGDYAPGYIGTEVAYSAGRLRDRPEGLARGPERGGRAHGRHEAIVASLRQPAAARRGCEAGEKSALNADGPRVIQ